MKWALYWTWAPNVEGTRQRLSKLRGREGGRYRLTGRVKRFWFDTDRKFIKLPYAACAGTKGLLKGRLWARSRGRCIYLFSQSTLRLALGTACWFTFQQRQYPVSESLLLIRSPLQSSALTASWFLLGHQYNMKRLMGARSTNSHYSISQLNSSCWKNVSFSFRQRRCRFLWGYLYIKIYHKDITYVII